MKIFVFPCVGAAETVGCFINMVLLQSIPWKFFTDSDWASNKETRLSISCSTIILGNCLLYSSSRTQKLVSLSSAEAEVYACSSGASDGLLLAGIISWMTNSKVTIYLLTDSSGARGILQRQGVGRVRHLSCRILWLQEYINSGQIKLSTVAALATQLT